MKCPHCQADHDKVTDKRAWEGNGLSGTKRRRVCLSCGHRWTTLELIITFGQGRAVVLPEINGNGYKPVYKPEPKPQKALTAKERDLKKRLAMALHRARCRAVVIEDEELD